MKLQNRDILQLFETIRALDAILTKAPAKITYANSRNITALTPAYTAVNKVRAGLIEECGIKDKKSAIGYKLEADGRTMTFKDEKSKKKWSDELGPILDEEIEVDLYTISIDCFDGVEIDTEKIPTIPVYYKWIVTD